jgi:hypothetical protein
MKLMTAAIKTSPLAASVLGGASLVLLVLKVAWLNFVDPLFPHAQELGVIAEGFLIANVSAYIFFVLAVQLPIVVEKWKLAEPIMRRSELAANRVQGFLQMIAGSQNKGLLIPDEVTIETVERLFASVSPNANAPMIKDIHSPQLSWLGAMVAHQQQCKDAIHDVWRFARFLDADLILLLDKLDEAFQTDTMILEMLRPGVILQFDNLLGWVGQYYNCYDLARDLENYCAEFRATYGLPGTLRSRG